MEEYKVVFNGQLANSLSQEVVLNRIQSGLKLSSGAAVRLLSTAPRVVKKAVSEEDAIRFQAQFKKIGLVTEIVKNVPAISLEPTQIHKDIEPVPTPQASFTSHSIDPPPLDSDQAFRESEDKNIKSGGLVKGLIDKLLMLCWSLFKLSILKLSNLVLIIGIVLVVLYFPFMDGIVRYGFAVGMVLMASSLSLKSTGR